MIEIIERNVMRILKMMISVEIWKNRKKIIVVKWNVIFNLNVNIYKWLLKFVKIKMKKNLVLIFIKKKINQKKFQIYAKKKKKKKKNKNQ